MARCVVHHRIVLRAAVVPDRHAVRLPAPAHLVLGDVGLADQKAQQIARAWIEIANRATDRAVFLERTVNGQPGLVVQQDGEIVTVFAFDVAGDRIRRIWAVRNPEKLRPWTTP